MPYRDAASPLIRRCGARQSAGPAPFTKYSTYYGSHLAQAHGPAASILEHNGTHNTMLVLSYVTRKELAPQPLANRIRHHDESPSSAIHCSASGPSLTLAAATQTSVLVWLAIDPPVLAHDLLRR